jgi:uncharacterized protein YukE
MPREDTKDQIIEKGHKWLDETSTRIDQLRVQANLAKQDARDQLNEELKRLEEEKEKIRHMMATMEAASGDAFKAVKKGGEQAMDEVNQAVRKASDRISQFVS